MRPLSHPTSCMFVNHGPSQQSSKEEYKPWKWGATARYYILIQRPCYPRGSTCQDPAGNWTTRKPPDDRKETQTTLVWSCFPFIRSGQNHFARHNERGKKTRQTESVVGRQHQEWKGLESGRSQRTVENREKWRKLVLKSSVVPQLPSRLRDWVVVVVVEEVVVVVVVAVAAAAAAAAAAAVAVVVQLYISFVECYSYQFFL